MRGLVWVGSVGLFVAAAALAAACDEHFPAQPAGDAGVTALVDGGALESEPPAIVPPDQRRNASSSPVAFDPLRGGVWTANGDVGTISYVDVDRRQTVKEVPVGGDVRSIALSPDGAWVAAVDRAGGSVALLDAETATVRRTIPVGSHPRACVWDAANPRWLYVAVEDDGTLLVVDRTLGQVADTLAVGRLPAGLAVSATRREVYVTHRVDADVTIVDLHERTVAADVPLADEPFQDPKTPNGKPFGFESLALTVDGRRGWIPHELLAPTHPFAFTETLFPAISVFDPAHRLEVRTDPNSPNTDGRKNLFDAVNLQGPDGQPLVFSQFCAVAMHPNGLVAWALACGSEDLLTFDVNEGVATDFLRDLPGDHPVGMTLDDTGQRIFVLSDQSKTLVTLDTAGGSLVQHTHAYGQPITVASDTVAQKQPQLRAGLTLFYRANSAKGALATTGNFWMSCGGCHLDGFVSTNLRLFEALQPPNAQRDAQIGHVGLTDHFATAATPTDPSFSPHDILVALLDQGGLSPDRTGAQRTGQVDPSHPSADAATMAQQLASVVARDLPSEPTWLRTASSTVSDTQWTPEYCGKSGCHEAEYAAWSKSVHAHAAEDPMVKFGLGAETGIQGDYYGRLCAGCHDPVGMRVGDHSLSDPTRTGITCIGCHDVDAQIRAGGNADLSATPHDWSSDHKAWGLASLERLRQPEFCGGCHQQFVPGTGLVAISTLDEYHASSYAGATRCVDCHARRDANGVADHRFPGGNVYMGKQYGDAALVADQQKNLTSAVQLVPQQVAGGVLVKVVGRGAGHSFPTGVTDIREPWVEIQAVDAQGNVLQRFGGPDATGAIPPGAARLGIDIAEEDGTLLYRHELSEATRIPFDVRVPAREAQALFVPVPQPWPAGTQSLQAVLYYRNVRTSYFRLATGNPAGAAPDVEVARVGVP